MIDQQVHIMKTWIERTVRIETPNRASCYNCFVIRLDEQDINLIIGFEAKRRQLSKVSVTLISTTIDVESNER